MRESIHSARSVYALGLLTLSLVGLLITWQSDGTWAQSSAVLNPPTGFVARSVEFEGQPYSYTIFVPPAYETRDDWPVVLFLHGSGERGYDNQRQTEVGIGAAIRKRPNDFPCIVVMPQCPEYGWWRDDWLYLALASLDDTLDHYPRADRRRVSLTGLSMGGYGAWELAARFPRRFVALLPICGGGDSRYADALATLPIWCYHGDQDPAVSVDQSRKMVTAVRTAGGDVRYTELVGVRHNAWDAAYRSRRTINWLLDPPHSRTTGKTGTVLSSRSRLRSDRLAMR